MGCLLYPSGLGACIIIISGLTVNGAEKMSYSMQVTAVVMLMLWFSFQITWGPLAWVLTAEVPPKQVREKTVAMSGIGAYIKKRRSLHRECLVVSGSKFWYNASKQISLEFRKIAVYSAIIQS